MDINNHADVHEKKIELKLCGLTIWLGEWRANIIFFISHSRKLELLLREISFFFPNETKSFVLKEKNLLNFFFFVYFQLGIAVGFLLPAKLVKNHDELPLIRQDLLFMFYLIAGLTTTLLITIFICKLASAGWGIKLNLSSDRICLIL